MAWPNSFVDRTAPSGSSIRNNLSAEVNSVWTSVETLEQIIGLLPQGAQATIAARLDAMQAQIDALTDAATEAADAAVAAHQTDTAPHPGHFGAIITPQRPGGDGTLYIGGTISATGEDNVGWVDT